MRTTVRRLVCLSATLAAVLSAPEVAGGQIRYPGPYGGPYPYGPYRLGGLEAELKIKVQPKEAAVYVDGYFAGIVDDFDGAFQSLHVVPGQHEIVVYLEGYRSITEKLYLGPHTSRKLERTMEKLGPGEPNDPKPEPTEPPEPTQTPQPRAPRRP